MPSYMYPELPALNSQPAAAAAASSPATKMKLAKLWGMKGNSRKGWGRDPILLTRILTWKLSLHSLPCLL